ncbi:MAG: hypothetical protein HFF52_03770 [Lawsonibacter sp.]|nr:hypothetical protein [Lawsonibacter sp.]
MNVYHTAQYQAYRQRCGFVFSEEHRSELPGKTQALSGGYSVRTDYYTGHLEYQICAARHQLLDSGGRVVYTWDNLDFDGEFCALISHANGNQYLVFREDLYGYSVLEVETGENLHYIPEKSWPLDGRMGQETFIWTGADYDPETNLLAVWGCYWACPGSMVFLDFSNPLSEQDCSCWVEMHEMIDPDYELFDEIELVRWNVRGWTGFRCTSAVEDTSWEEELVPREKILDAVRKKKLEHKERG